MQRLSWSGGEAQGWRRGACWSISRNERFVTVSFSFLTFYPLL